MAEEVLLTAEDIDRIIKENADRICRDIKDVAEFAIVGVQTRGVEIARRLKARIEANSGRKINEGIIDITFYRDDLATKGVLPVIKETRIGFDIRNMTILLVDDVLFTGRSVKAAIETLMSFGRPRAIRLFVLVDRGNRELPIQPDYCGIRIPTGLNDKIKVLLSPVDNVEDSVIITRP